jgi:uroporphyrinogen-III synthase
VRPTPSFDGARVLALESRRATEISTLISKLGGACLLAPALREVPLESNEDAVRFAGALIDGSFDVVVFLTGVGARALLATVERRHSREAFVAALSRTRVAVRGPKPLAVMREWQVPVWIVAPEPNTWRELLAEIDAHAADRSMQNARVAVQEYGVSNPELLAGLTARGANVTRVPVYQWTLPQDVEPLRRAAHALARGEVDVILLTSGVQLAHLWQIVEEQKLEEDVRRGLARTVIASIGPTTSEELTRRGLIADLQASHPKMGILVTEAAAQCAGLLEAKRSAGR